MTAPFEVNKHDAGDGTVRLIIAGELDGENSEVLSAVISNTLLSSGVREIVLDVRRAAFLDAAGVRALLVGFHAAAERGCQYRVTNAAGIVRRVLEITRLTDMLNVSTVDHPYAVAANDFKSFPA